MTTKPNRNRGARNETPIRIAQRADGRWSGRLQIVGWTTQDIRQLITALQGPFPQEATALEELLHTNAHPRHTKDRP